MDFDMEKFEHQLQELYEIANRDSESIKDAVKIIVPTYVKPETVNEQVEKKYENEAIKCLRKME